MLNKQLFDKARNVVLRMIMKGMVKKQVQRHMNIWKGMIDIIVLGRILLIEILFDIIILYLTFILIIEFVRHKTDIRIPPSLSSECNLFQNSNETSISLLNDSEMYKFSVTNEHQNSKNIRQDVNNTYDSLIQMNKNQSHNSSRFTEKDKYIREQRKIYQDNLNKQNAAHMIAYNFLILKK